MLPVPILAWAGAPFRRAAVMLVAGVLSVAATAPAAASETEAAAAIIVSPQVRWSDPLVGRLFETGLARSPSFAQIVTALERSTVVVYVELDRRPRADLAGALYFMASGGAMRYVRVQLYPGTTSSMTMLGNEAALVGTLGHELQHALEVAEHEWVRDGAGLAAMLQRVGYELHSRVGTHAFETARARAIGARIEREVRSRNTTTAPSLAATIE